MFSNLGGNEAVLLWTNPNRHTQFSSQTISLNLTDYDGVIIEAADMNSGIINTRVYMRKDDTTSGSSFGFGMGYVYESGSTGGGRSIRVSNSGVWFGSGQTDNYSNSYCIPVYIYGVNLDLKK